MMCAETGAARPLGNRKEFIAVRSKFLNTSSLNAYKHITPEKSFRQKMSPGSMTWQLGVTFLRLLNRGEQKMVFPACYGQETRILIDLLHDRNPKTRPEFDMIVEYLVSLQQSSTDLKKKKKAKSRKTNKQLLETAHQCGWVPCFDKLYLQPKLSWKNPTKTSITSLPRDLIENKRRESDYAYQEKLQFQSLCQDSTDETNFLDHRILKTLRGPQVMMYDSLD